ADGEREHRHQRARKLPPAVADTPHDLSKEVEMDTVAPASDAVLITIPPIGLEPPTYQVSIPNLLMVLRPEMTVTNVEQVPNSASLVISLIGTTIGGDQVTTTATVATPVSVTSGTLVPSSSQAIPENGSTITVTGCFAGGPCPTTSNAIPVTAVNL